MDTKKAPQNSGPRTRSQNHCTRALPDTTIVGAFFFSCSHLLSMVVVRDIISMHGGMSLTGQACHFDEDEWSVFTKLHNTYMVTARCRKSQGDAGVMISRHPPTSHPPTLPTWQVSIIPFTCLLTCFLTQSGHHIACRVCIHTQHGEHGWQIWSPPARLGMYSTVPTICTTSPSVRLAYTTTPESLSSVYTARARLELP